MKVFTCTNFTGVWPVGVAAVIVAKDRKEARKLFMEELDNRGLIQANPAGLTFEELPLSKSGVTVLNDGDY